MVNSIVAVKPLLSSKVTIDRSYDPKVIEKYLTDESKIFTGIAEAVVFPTDEPQIGPRNRNCISDAGSFMGLSLKYDCQRCCRTRR